MTNSHRKVVVVGSGAAGLVSAIAAAESGASVTLLERAHRLGGTTAISAGGAWIPANHCAASAGIQDSVPDALQYLRAVLEGGADLRLLEVFVSHASKVSSALQTTGAVRWQSVEWPDFHPEFPGGKQRGRLIETGPVAAGPEIDAAVRPDPRGIGPLTFLDRVTASVDAVELSRRVREGVLARGRGLVAGLLKTARARGVQTHVAVQAKELRMHRGRVVGLTTADGMRYDGRVVLATGGFERDRELVRTFLSGPMLAPGGSPHGHGDGLRMGMAAGAEVGNMSEAWWSPAMDCGELIEDVRFYRMLLNEAGSPGCILVDSRGMRFANELSPYNDLGRRIVDHDGGGFPRIPSWLIFDARCRASRRFGSVRGSDPDPKWMLRAESIQDLSHRIGVSDTRLRETLGRFNEDAARGVDTAFGRGTGSWDRWQTRAATQVLRSVEGPPYYAIRVLPGCESTKGGLRIDASARVVRADGDGPIGGLYAAGDVIASPLGDAFPASGCSIALALTFGWIAGTDAAR